MAMSDKGQTPYYILRKSNNSFKIIIKGHLFTSFDFHVLIKT